jgi:hypothetical protein
MRYRPFYKPAADPRASTKVAHRDRDERLAARLLTDSSEVEFRMVLKTWRFATILLVATLATMTFSHLWQLPTRMSYSPGIWFSTLDLYEQLGPQGPGPSIEVSALFFSLVLVPMVWHRSPAFGLSLFAALVLLISFAAWWMFVYPLNLQLQTWTDVTIPADWSVYRVRWEYAHAARALCSLIALAALVWSVVVETPEVEDAPAVGWQSTPGRAR